MLFCPFDVGNGTRRQVEVKSQPVLSPSRAMSHHAEATTMPRVSVIRGLGDVKLIK